MITLQNYPEIMTADEVCEILNISKTTVLNC
ncbi:MAG: helix-turn-helix domain-containing protein [Lachnospiraceae bacterium]|nr:helix-turn-helix domain-containing protein [Lachnospiraceae bacterium]